MENERIDRRSRIARRGSTGTIHLPCGRTAIIDAADVERCRALLWRSRPAKHTIYACATVTRGEVKTTIGLAPFVLGISDPKREVDHRDHDGLNNRRGNLRRCTRSQNIMNSKNRKHGYIVSRFRGVHFNHTKKNPWSARINVRGRRYHLGAYPSERKAALAYDAAARKRCGEFATVNFRNRGVK
jgi:hypothetical protein